MRSVSRAAHPLREITGGPNLTPRNLRTMPRPDVCESLMS